MVVVVVVVVEVVMCFTVQCSMLARGDIRTKADRGKSNPVI